MVKKIYVVRLGGKLYIQDALYSLYQATTKDITKAYFYDDEIKAQRAAAKAHGEVVELTLSDGNGDSEIDSVKEELNKTKSEFEHLKEVFAKFMGQNK